MTNEEKLQQLREAIANSGISREDVCRQALDFVNSLVDTDYETYYQAKDLLKENGFWIQSEFCSWVDAVGYGEWSASLS